MAKIHRISRQTLIYYDKIGLFKPVLIDKNGYRLYSVTQIPYLREICFLKDIGIKLNDIKQHIKNRNPDSAVSLLEYHKETLSSQIAELTEKYEYLSQRLEMYRSIHPFENAECLPSLEYFEEREVVFFPWEGELCRETLHLTLMKGWNEVTTLGMLPSSGFGALFFKNQLEKGDILKGAGGFINLPRDKSKVKTRTHIVTLPAGDYICCCKYGMPYDLGQLNRLLEWIAANGYELCGDIVDECLLDTTFYGKSDEEVSRGEDLSRGEDVSHGEDLSRGQDFCQLQIPVKKKLNNSADTNSNKY